MPGYPRPTLFTVRSKLAGVFNEPLIRAADGRDIVPDAGVSVRVRVSVVDCRCREEEERTHVIKVARGHLHDLATDVLLVLLLMML